MSIKISSTSRYTGVQGLRGLAAMLVVIFHIFRMLRDKFGAPPIHFAPGAGGVDIFFAISGFVIVITSAKMWQKPGSWAPFLSRRLWRVVPLYWLMTGIMAIMLLVAPNLSEHNELTPWHALSSFLFIPDWNSEHDAFPLLVAGWTLPFEMFFYALFAGALALHIKPVPALSILLTVLAAIGSLRSDDWGAPATLIDPMLLEFVFGMWIGVATLKNIRIPTHVASWLAPLMLVLFLATCLLPVQFCFNNRVIVWGIPGALLLASTIALEEKLQAYLSGLPRQLGDASYAIYLSHSFSISFVALLFTKLQLGGILAMLTASFLCLILSAISGVIIYRFIEQPLMAWRKKSSARPMPAYA